MDKLVEFILASKKAVAAALAGWLVTYLVKQGVELPDNAGQVFEALIGAAVIGAAVWFAPKNKETKKKK